MDRLTLLPHFRGSGFLAALSGLRPSAPPPPPSLSWPGHLFSSSPLARWQWHADFCWSRVLYGLSALPFAVLTLPAQALLGVCFPCDAAPTGYDRRGRCVLCKAAA